MIVLYSPHVLPNEEKGNLRTTTHKYLSKKQNNINNNNNSKKCKRIVKQDKKGKEFLVLRSTKNVHCVASVVVSRLVELFSLPRCSAASFSLSLSILFLCVCWRLTFFLLFLFFHERTTTLGESLAGGYSAGQTRSRRSSRKRERDKSMGVERRERMKS